MKKILTTLSLVLIAFSAHAQTSAVPPYSHIVLVVLENHTFEEMEAAKKDPFIKSLEAGGAVMTNSHAITHPSQPNYFALYSGATQGIHSNHRAFYNNNSLMSNAASGGRMVSAFVEDGSPYTVRPWKSFSDSGNVEKQLSEFPSDYSLLPAISFVTPNLLHDMHNGTIAAADAWLQSNLEGFAQWAKDNNSLLIVTFDEADKKITGKNNYILTIFYGAHIVRGRYSRSINHYSVLRTVCAAVGIRAPGIAGRTAPITEIF